MHLVTKKKSFILFCISSCLIVHHGKAQNCHKLSTLQKPTQLLCNGFENILHFDIEIDDDVKHIDLSKNNLTNINEASFTRNLNNVVGVYLDNNSITTIGSNAFRHLPNLEILDLSHNNITFIDPEAFLLNTKLKVIDLTGNQILGLDKKTINRLDSLEELALSGNPIKVCSRKTADALSYLKRKRIDTHFPDSCEGLIEDDDDVITEPISANLSDKRLLIFVVLGVLSSLALVMSIVVSLLCLKILNKKKFNSTRSRRQRTLSGRGLLISERFSFTSEENDGYLIPKYQHRLSTASQDRDGYMIPTKAKNSPKYIEVIENEFLIKREPTYLKRVLSTTPVPNDRQSEYSGSHLYEEIKESSLYERIIPGFH